MRRRSGFGWLELVIGILLIVLGVLTLAKPDIALTGLVFAYGLAAIIMGVADIILYLKIAGITTLTNDANAYKALYNSEISNSESMFACLLYTSS